MLIVAALAGCGDDDVGADEANQIERPSEPTTVTCRLERLDSTPQGSGSVEATLPLGEEEAYADSDGLDVYEENYSFSAGYYQGGSLDVFFFENYRTQDEVGSIGCDFPEPLESGAVFCEDTIEIDLAEPAEAARYERVADFACRVD